MNHNTNSNINNPKYLIIVTLVDGQNFTIPDGAHDRIEASVFAEARFANESVLRSDPIKLVNSNPQFVTELAWQLDKKSLHQLRVQRRAIKLQVFMQTLERKKNRQQQQSNEDNRAESNGDSLNETNKIELIGYTIISIRTAQETDVPKLQWHPLLNPKFRKSSYNRPEVQLGLTLNRIDENPSVTSTSHHSPVKRPERPSGHYSECSDSNPSETAPDDGCMNDTTNCLYKTCLDTTPSQIDDNSDRADQSLETTEHDYDNDEIIDNDIQIHSRDGNFYIYDIRNADKFTINDCDEPFRIWVKIPFNSDLDLLLMKQEDHSDFYYFSINLFGSSVKMRPFERLTSVETNEMYISVFTTHSSILTTYFELNPSIMIKFHQGRTGLTLGFANIQVDQLCSLEAKRRSVEGIFAMQPACDNDEISSPIRPTIGVSVVLEKVVGQSAYANETNTNESTDNSIIHSLSRLHRSIVEDIDGPERKTFDTTHQLTIDDITTSTDNDSNTMMNNNDFEKQQFNVPNHNIIDPQDDNLGPNDKDHHFCFTIDLKNFSYTQDQRLIPTLRELLVRYSYPFFGYKDPITTDASIPISPTNSIIVSGFCEFNFATTYESLLAAMTEIPLHLDILTCDHQTSRRTLDTLAVGEEGHTNNLILDGGSLLERVVATCSLNLAQILNLSETTDQTELERAISKTESTPIIGLNGEINGHLQVYLCLKDLGLLSSTEQNRKTATTTISNSNSSNTIINNNLDNLNLSNNNMGNNIELENQYYGLELNENYIRNVSTEQVEINDRSATITKSKSSDVCYKKLMTFMAESRAEMESWQDKIYKKLSDDCKIRESERLKRIELKFEAKECKRDQEFKDKMKELNNLERRFKTSLSAIDSLEKMLRCGFDQLKNKDANLDFRLDAIDSKISQALKDINHFREKEKQQQQEDEEAQKQHLESIRQKHERESQTDAINTIFVSKEQLPSELHQSEQQQTTTKQQQPLSLGHAKKLSFYPSKYSRSSDGNIVISDTIRHASSNNRIMSSIQNHQTTIPAPGTSNGILKATSNTRLSNAFTVIDVPLSGERGRCSKQQGISNSKIIGNKWNSGQSSGIATYNNNAQKTTTNNNATQTVYTRIGSSGHIHRVR